MFAECNRESFGFHALGRRDVVARFDGGRITSDAGGLLLRETERLTGIIDQFAACFTDHRNPELIEHTVEELVAQRVYALTLGYEDLNDHDDLRHDPLLAVLVGKLGQSRGRARDRGKALAGKSTLNRLELTPVRANAKSRYKKITLDRQAVQYLFTDVFVQSHQRPPKRIAVGPGCHRRCPPRPAVGAILPRLLQELLLPAAVYLLRRASLVRPFAPVEHRRVGGQRQRVATNRWADSPALANGSDCHPRRLRLLP